MSMNINLKIDKSKIEKIKKEADEALFLTGEALHTEVVQAQVMPFDTGTMQNTATSVQRVKEKEVQLKTVTDYAARMYFHPEYDFQKTSNPNAQGRWLDRWISGSDKNWCAEAFAKILKQRTGT